MRSLLVAVTGLILLSAQGLSAPTIAFNRVELRAGQPAIFVAASDGSDEHLLLPNADADYDAVWVPDGKSIVFTSERNGSADLFRVNPDGSGLTALTTDPAYDGQAAFSPDGQKLVFVSTRQGGTANLWLLDLTSLHAQRLTTGRAEEIATMWRFTRNNGITEGLPHQNGGLTTLLFGKDRFALSRMPGFRRAARIGH
jgi:TolB protein